MLRAIVLAPARCVCPMFPDHGERPSPPRDGKAPPHAPGVVGRGFAAAVVARARGGRPRRAALDCRRRRKRASPTGDGLGQRSGLQDRRHEGRAGALVALACDALKGSRVQRRWPLPETTEQERASWLARGAVRKRRRRLAVAGIFGSPPLFGAREREGRGWGIICIHINILRLAAESDRW